jgi:CRP-like cAMP-binding protein/ABC-type thiamine transport system ATPase subunit
LELVALGAQFDSGETVRNINIALPPVRLIGLVGTTRVDPDYLCALLSGDANPTEGMITLDGRDVRHDDVKSRIWSVPANSSSFNDSIAGVFRGVHPTISDDEILSALNRFGLAHLSQLPTGIDQPLGPGGEQLTRNERQRLALAIVLTTRPEFVTVGPLLGLADSDTGMPLLQVLKESVTTSAIVSINTADLAETTDAVLFVDSDGVHLGTHRELLMSSSNYAHHWAQRLAGEDVDLSVLGIPDGDEQALLTRLVTESYSPGEVIYRQGDPADRIVFTIAGRVEILSTDAHGVEHRLAVLGPGNHCGDLRLAPGEERSETVRALDDVVVRSLSREAISAGVTGLLDRTVAERQVVAALLRNGPTPLSQLASFVPALQDDDIKQALTLLERDGAVTQENGIIRAVQKRRGRSGAADLLDRLTDL